MPFKDDSDTAHVEAFRRIRAAVVKLDESIDAGLLTPWEAVQQIQGLLDLKMIPDPAKAKEAEKPKEKKNA